MGSIGAPDPLVITLVYCWVEVVRLNDAEQHILLTSLRRSAQLNGQPLQLQCREAMQLSTLKVCKLTLRACDEAQHHRVELDVLWLASRKTWSCLLLALGSSCNFSCRPSLDNSLTALMVSSTDLSAPLSLQLLLLLDGLQRCPRNVTGGPRQTHRSCSQGCRSS